MMTSGDVTSVCTQLLWYLVTNTVWHMHYSVIYTTHELALLSQDM